MPVDCNPNVKHCCDGLSAIVTTLVGLLYGWLTLQKCTFFGANCNRQVFIAIDSTFGCNSYLGRFETFNSWTHYNFKIPRFAASFVIPVQEVANRQKTGVVPFRYGAGVSDGWVRSHFPFWKLSKILSVADRWMAGWMDWWMDGWMDGRMTPLFVTSWGTDKHEFHANL